jgi:hypothetical protein
MAFAQIQTIPISFQGAIQGKIDPLQLQPPNLLTADNVTFNKLGVIEKRPGFQNVSRLANSGSISNGAALSTLGNELLLFNGDNIYSYVSSQNSWINRGSAYSVINRTKIITRTKVANQYNPDATSVATDDDGNGIEVYAYEDDRSGVRYAIVDSLSGAFIVPDTALDVNGFQPKTINVKGQVYVVYAISTTSLGCKILNTQNPSVLPQPAAILCRDANGQTLIPYDATYFDNNLLFAYANQTGGIVLSMGGGAYNAFVTIATATYTNANASIISLAVDSANNIWLTYVNAGGINILRFTLVGNNFILQQTATTLDASPYIVNVGACEDVLPGNLCVVYELQDGSNNNFIRTFSLNQRGQTNINANIGHGNEQRGVGLASKPFRNGSNIFVNTVFVSPNQSTYFTLNVTENYAIVNKMNSQLGGGYRNNILLAQCDPYLATTSSYLFANQLKGLFTSFNGQTYTSLGVNATYIDFNASNAFLSITGSRNLHIVGGVEQIYDGNSVVEDNFNTYVEFQGTCGATVVPGGNIATGTYFYQFVYEWTDNNGQRQQSQPSIPVSVTLTANSNVSFILPTCRLTAKALPRSPISIAAYRTTAVGANVYYKVTSDIDITKMILNNTLVDSVTWVDNSPDNAITANEDLYTASQVYNSAPPSCSLICNYNNRIMLSGMEDPNIVWFSQDKFELDNYNTIPIEFSALFTIGVDSTNDTSGPITAIAKINNTFVVFKEASIFIMAGNGPEPSGAASDFIAPTILTSDVGCVNPNSIEIVPQNQNNAGGIMFKSKKGIYLLDQNLQVSYIGAPAEDYNDYTITASELLTATNEIVFTTLEGTIIVYNYYFNYWYTWSGLSAVDACIWQDKLCILQQNGTVLIQNQDTYYDEDESGQRFVFSTITTPNLAFGGMQGYFGCYNVHLYGTFLGNHVLQVGISYNNSGAIDESVSINGNLCYNQYGSDALFGDSSVFGGTLNQGVGDWVPYQFRINFSKPFAQAIKLTITDSEMSSYNKGYSLSHMLFEVAVFPGAFPVPRTVTIGGAGTGPTY